MNGVALDSHGKMPKPFLGLKRYKLALSVVGLMLTLELGILVA